LKGVIPAHLQKELAANTPWRYRACAFSQLPDPRGITVTCPDLPFGRQEKCIDVLVTSTPDAAGATGEAQRFRTYLWRRISGVSDCQPAS
jgi:hypothetical protein